MSIHPFFEKFIGLWVVEWSEKQGHFHVEQAARRFQVSVAQYLLREARGGWVALGVFNSHAEAHEFIREIETLRGEAAAND